ncbi:MAG TPA: hypothetical protein VHE53_04245 [Patescibacteria group bacterium]|nr:hypothetical protein [Patescibacteria group bacterium]
MDSKDIPQPEELDREKIDKKDSVNQKISQTRISRRGLLKGFLGLGLTSILSSDKAMGQEAPIIPEHKFNSIDELNDYVRAKEKRLGWNDQEPQEEPFGDKFRAERARLRPSNNERTLGFVVSEKLISDLNTLGENPTAILTRHVDYLNNLYKNAGVNLKYDLTDIAILPDDVVGSYKDTLHQQKRGVKLKAGEVPYPRYQDSTWVLSSDCNDQDIPNYAEKLKKRFTDMVDKGLIHELVHHVGIGDFYVSQREFGPTNTPPITRFLPDHSGFMGGGNWSSLSQWEAFYLQKFIENGTFSPQHDGDAISNIKNPQTQQLEQYQRLISPLYKFKVADSHGSNLLPRIDGLYHSTQTEDQEKHHFLTGDTFTRSSEEIVIPNIENIINESKRQNKGDPTLFVFKSSFEKDIWLPFDAHLLILYRLAQGTEDGKASVIVNTEMPEFNNPCSIGFDVIARTQDIPTQFMGNNIYGYSDINENLRGVWWVKPNN